MSKLSLKSQFKGVNGRLGEKTMTPLWDSVTHSFSLPLVKQEDLSYKLYQVRRVEE